MILIIFHFYTRPIAWSPMSIAHTQRNRRPWHDFLATLRSGPRLGSGDWDALLQPPAYLLPNFHQLGMGQLSGCTTEAEHLSLRAETLADANAMISLVVHQAVLPCRGTCGGRRTLQHPPLWQLRRGLATRRCAGGNQQVGDFGLHLLP